MPDLTDQLRGYHDSLAATVEPVTAAEAMTTEAPPSPEARDRRARWQWRTVAAAAAALVVLVGWVAFTGSSGPMRWLTGDDADALRGRTFNAVSMTEGGGAPEPAVGSLTFSGDSVDLYDGCNTMNAPFSIERGRLVVGPGVTTAMNCGQDGTGPERWARVLSSAGIALDGDRLTLSDDTITVELVDEYASSPPVAPAELATANWTAGPCAGPIDRGPSEERSPEQVAAAEQDNRNSDAEITRTGFGFYAAPTQDGGWVCGWIPVGTGIDGAKALIDSKGGQAVFDAPSADAGILGFDFSGLGFYSLGEVEASDFDPTRLRVERYGCDIVTTETCRTPETILANGESPEYRKG